jgi:hypothetical protein
MIEGSGSLNKGSGSRRPKNIRIPRICNPDGIWKQEGKNDLPKKKKKKQIHGMKCWIFALEGLRLLQGSPVD